MLKAKMTRRTFTKIAAITGAAAVLSTNATVGNAIAETTASAAPLGEVKHVRTCCRGCGKMECGVWVTVRDGKVLKIEGDESSWGSEGNCCIKSQASIQALYHPDRVKSPLVRTNPKTEADPGWMRVTWDELYDKYWIPKLKELCEKYGTETYFRHSGTSRFNGVAMGGFQPGGNGPYTSGVQVCKGPRRFVGAMTLDNGAYFYATTDYPKMYIQWGTDQTQSNYDDSGRVVNEVAQHAKVFVSVDPKISHCGKEADYHFPLRPGTDAALALGWLHVVMRDELYDDLVLRKWTNAPFLYCEEVEPTGWDGVSLNTEKLFPVRTRLLKQSDIMEGGDVHKFMVWDEANDRLAWWNADEKSEDGDMWEGQTEWDIPTTGYTYETAGGGWVPDLLPMPVDIIPALWGEYPVTLKDGRQVTCKTVFQKLWDESVKDMTPEKSAEITGCDANMIEEVVKIWTTRMDERIPNCGINFQLAPEQTGNCTLNFRTLYVLFLSVGAYDTPGANRGQTRVPLTWTTPRPVGVKYTGNLGNDGKTNMEKRAHMPGSTKFPMLRWWTIWNDGGSVYEQIASADPYPIKFMITYAGGIQQMSNALFVYEAVRDNIDFYVQNDLWHSVAAGISDIFAPGCHWLEQPFWHRNAQGGNGQVGINRKVVDIIGDTKFDYEILMQICHRYGQPFFAGETIGGELNDNTDIMEAFDYDLKLTQRKGEGPLVGYSASEYQKTGELKQTRVWNSINDYIEDFTENSWFNAKHIQPKRWGTYRRYCMGYLRQSDSSMCPCTNDWKLGMPTPTMKGEIWSTISESILGQFSTEEKDKWDGLMPRFDPSPISLDNTPELAKEYPFTMTTGARVVHYFHSEHRQLPWCREAYPVPRLSINPDDAAALGIEQGDWVWIESTTGARIRQVADLNYGMMPGILDANHHWMFPELKEAQKGYDLCQTNDLVDLEARDHYTGSSQLRGYLVKIWKATPENSPFGNPVPCGIDGTPIIHDPSDPRLKEWAGQIEEIRNNTASWEVYAK